MVEQLPGAETCTTTAAPDSNLVFCWALRKGGGTGAGRAGATGSRSECRGEADAMPGCASGSSASYGRVKSVSFDAPPPCLEAHVVALLTLLSTRCQTGKSLTLGQLRSTASPIGWAGTSHVEQGPAQL